MSTVPKITIQAKDVEAVAKSVGATPAQVGHALTVGVWEAELLLQREVTEATPTGVAGALRASVIAAPPVLAAGNILGAVGTPLAYAIPVELGTKKHWAPLQPLKDWVKAKLGLKGDEGEQVARAIQRKIAAHGTKGAFMFTETFKTHGDQAGARALMRVRRVLLATESV